MSYPMVVGPDRQRPTVVTAAGYLLYLVAGLLVVNTIVSIATFSTAVHAIDTTYVSDPNHDVLVTAAKVGIGVGIAIDVALVALLIVLGIFDLRGRNGMRITTWVIAGLGALCLGCGAFGNFTGSAFQQSGTTSQRTTVNLKDILPSWAVHTSMAINIISLLALATVIILLATPASNAFFRKAPAMVMYPGYPGYPAGGVYPVSGVHPADPPYPTYPPQYPPGPPQYPPGPPQYPPGPPTDGPVPPA